MFFRKATSSLVVSSLRLQNASTRGRFFSTKQNAPVKVALTGSAGQIGYSTAFKIASGQLLGDQQPVILQLVEVPSAVHMLDGVKMELEDCAFPLLHGVESTSSLEEGFGDADIAILVGSRPRVEGQERSDLLHVNGHIFKMQGEALSRFAKSTCKVLVVGNPANTNALICAANCKNIDASNIAAMTRLDHSRAVGMLAKKANALAEDVKKLCVWGNHSISIFSDITNATIKGRPANQVIKDDNWVRSEFVPQVQRRGAVVIATRKASSAASAATAAVATVHDWMQRTPTGDYSAMAVALNDGEYGLKFDGGPVIFGVPLMCENGRWEKVTDVEIGEETRKGMQDSLKELIMERDMVKDLL